MDVLNNFEKWKDFLGDHVDRAQAMGVSEDKLAAIATKVGEYLADKIDPKNDQERLLKQLWECGDENEKKTLARLMVRLTDKAH